MKLNSALAIRDFKRWIANAITGGDLFIAEKELKYLELENKMRSQETVSSHVCPMPTAEAVIEKILNRPLAWVDMTKMDVATRRQWGGHATALLQNPLFQALCGTVGKTKSEETSGELVKDLIEHIAKKSKDHEETRDLRMTINGVELVRERAAAWLFFETQATNNEPNAPM